MYWSINIYYFRQWSTISYRWSSISDSGGTSPTDGVPSPTGRGLSPRQWRNIAGRQSSISDSRGTSPTGGVLFPTVEQHLLQAELFFRQRRNIFYRQGTIRQRRNISCRRSSISDGSGTSPIVGVLFPTEEEHLQAEFNFQQRRNISYRCSSISDSGGTSPTGRRCVRAVRTVPPIVGGIGYTVGSVGQSNPPVRGVRGTTAIVRRATPSLYVAYMYRLITTVPY